MKILAGVKKKRGERENLEENTRQSQLDAFQIAFFRVANDHSGRVIVDYQANDIWIFS